MQRLKAGLIPITLLLASSCLTPTEVTLQISSRELACTQTVGTLGFAGLAIVARRDDAAILSGAPDGVSTICTTEPSSTINLGSIVLVPKDASTNAEIVIASGVTIQRPDGTELVGTGESCLDAYRSFRQGGDPTADCGGANCLPCIVATREVGFVNHERLTLDVELDAQCKGVFCEAGQTCGGDGQCVSNRASCKGRTCDLTNGNGGAGGGTSSTSATASTGSGGASPTSSSSSTTGSGGDPFTPVLGQNAQPISRVDDLWGNGTDEIVWAAGETGLYRCTPTGCAKQPIAIAPPLTHVTGTTSLITITNGTNLETSSPVGAWAPNASAISCEVTDLAALANETLLTVAGASGTALLTTSKIPCTGIATAVPTPALLWANETGAPDEEYVASGASYESINGNTGNNLAGRSFVGLWGALGVGGSYALACDSAGQSIDLIEELQFQAIPIGFPCQAIWGIAQGTTSLFDVWTAIPGGALGIKFADYSPYIFNQSTALTGNHDPNDPTHAIYVSPLGVWIGSSAGLRRADRPMIP